MLISVSDSMDIQNDLYVCACGAKKSRTSKTCNKCFLKNRWSKFYADKKINQFFCYCACGCGNYIKDKRNTFYERSCAWRFKRQNKDIVKLKKCACGCGKKVRNNLKDFATKNCAIKSKEKVMAFSKYTNGEGYLTLIDRNTIIEDAMSGNGLAIQALRDLRFTRVFKSGTWLEL